MLPNARAAAIGWRPVPVELPVTPVAYQAVQSCRADLRAHATLSKQVAEVWQDAAIAGGLPARQGQGSLNASLAADVSQCRRRAMRFLGGGGGVAQDAGALFRKGAAEATRGIESMEAYAHIDMALLWLLVSNKSDTSKVCGK